MLRLVAVTAPGDGGRKGGTAPGEGTAGGGTAETGEMYPLCFFLLPGSGYSVTSASSESESAEAEGEEADSETSESEVKSATSAWGASVGGSVSGTVSPEQLLLLELA